MSVFAYARCNEWWHTEHCAVNRASTDQALARVRHARAKEADIAAQDPAAWHDFYVMSGGAAAALTGLVFVGLSLHAQAIMGNPFHRNRAITTVLSLTAQLLLSAAVLIPGQSLTALGSEVESAALVFLGVSIWSVVYRAPTAETVPMAPHRRAIEVAIAVPWNATFLAAGLLLLTGTSGGLYVLAGHMLLAFCWNIYIALVLVAEVSESP